MSRQPGTAFPRLRCRHSAIDEPKGGFPPHREAATGSRQWPQWGHEERFPPSRLNGRCRFGQATFTGTHGNERDAPKPAVPGTVGRPKRSRWFAALVAAVARYTRYRVLDQCETIETRIPQTSGDRTEDLSRFNRRFWAR